MSEQEDANNTKQRSRMSVLECSHADARRFFLKAESYCSLDLPPYLVFDSLLAEVDRILNGKKLTDLIGKPRDYDDNNYTIFNNKDGKYAWRPIQLVHPALYVSLVHRITEEDNWKLICERFKEFSGNDKIRCLSLPVTSLSDEKDKAERVSDWWQEVEQKSIELSLDYGYLLETDITDCYASIYTHSIAWALHTKPEAKKQKNRNNHDLIGNVIDGLIQDMRHGQTNGIPQGSVLMDFIAEMVLGYADLELSKRINLDITDYCILRYRDDYRIFTKNPQDGEKLVKLLTETTIDLGLKLSSSKTKASNDVVRASIKSDKLAWIGKKKVEKNLQKRLLSIHAHAIDFPNAGSLLGALGEHHKCIEKRKAPIEEPMPMVAIVVDIAYHNPRTYSICAAILSKLLSSIEINEEKQAVIKRIKNKFSQIPNTGHMQICLQRVTFPFTKDLPYDEPVCKLVAGESPQIWNNDWISSNALKDAVNARQIVDENVLKGIKPVIPSEEVELFVTYDS